MNWRSKITFQQPTYQTNDECDRYQALLFYIYIYIYIYKHYGSAKCMLRWGNFFYLKKEVSVEENHTSKGH